MRPIKLVMNAFGPFKKEVALDFTNFSQQNIFLVTGPTGAGKTTIFDAIAYALYGEASGDQRNVKEIKSQFAKDTDTCFVELVFEHKEKTYFIRREPMQMKPGKRSAVIESKGLVELRHEDKSLSKVTEVNDKILELLGLNYKQFQQIVLLPQGQFRKLLNSSSGEKEVIFRDIFDTEMIQDFQDAIREQVKELKAANETNRQMMVQALDKIVNVENESLEEAIERFDVSSVVEELNKINAEDEHQQEENKKALKHLSEKVDETKQIIGWLNDKQALEEKKIELDKVEQHIEDQNNQIKAHKEAQKLVTAEDNYLKKEKKVVERERLLTDHYKDQKELVKKAEEDTHVFEQLEKDYRHIDDWREEVQALKQKETNFEKLDTLTERLNEIEESNYQLEETLAANEKRHQEIAEEKATLEQEIDGIEEAKAQSKQLDREHLQLKESQLKIITEQEQLDAFEKENKRYGKLQSSYQEKEDKYTEAKASYDQALMAYRKNLAGLLANDLEIETPCPVCGSTAHPEKAELSADAVNKEVLEKYEKIYNEANNDWQVASEKARQCNENLGMYVEKTGVTIEKLTESKEKTAEELVKLSKQLKVVSGQMTSSEKRIAKEKELRQALSENREAASEAIGVEKETTARLEENKKNLKDLSQQLSELEEILKDNQLKDVIKDRKSLETQIITMDADYHKQKDHLAEVTNQVGQLKATITSDKNILEELKEERDDLKERFKKTLVTSGLDGNFRDLLLEETVVTTWQEEFETHTQQRHINSDRLEENKERLATLEDDRPQIESYTETLDHLLSEKEIKEENQQQMIQRLSLNTDAEKVLEENLAESGRIQKDYAVYSDLDDFASGSTATGNVSFERYVLGIYLDDILEAANARFTHMTNGRYALKRQEEQTSLQGKKGLEINVMDEYTGRLRSVSTLSGGESFKASLSLAMGLSDVIQSQQGGVSVDTLFVDEGFGTLDSDSLDKAIQTLLELNTNGRMIGIISHVEELKTRIPSHITVTKTQAGSQAEMTMN